MNQPGRNAPCPCGSGKKYKHCHLGRPDNPWVDGNLSFNRAIGNIGRDQSKTREEVLAVRVSEMTDLCWMNSDPADRSRIATEIIGIAPDNPYAHLILGQAEASPEKRIHHFDEAIRNAIRTLSPLTLTDMSIDPFAEGSSWAALLSYFYRALTDWEMGNIDLAMADFDRVARFDQTNAMRPRDFQLLMLAHLERYEDGYAFARRIRSTDKIGVETPYLEPFLDFQVNGDTYFARRWLAFSIDDFPSLADDLLSESEAIESKPLSQTFQALGLFGGTTAIEPDDKFQLGFHLLILVLQFEVWRRSTAAKDWLREVWDLGPQYLYENEYLGEGPAYLKVFGIDQTLCGNCLEKSVAEQTILVVRLYGERISSIPLTMRYCAGCNLYTSDFDQVLAALRKQGHRVIYPEFVELGLISADAANLPGADLSDPAWLTSHMTPFYSIGGEDMDDETWEEVIELEDELMGAQEGVK